MQWREPPPPPPKTILVEIAAVLDHGWPVCDSSSPKTHRIGQERIDEWCAPPTYDRQGSHRDPVWPRLLLLIGTRLFLCPLFFLSLPALHYSSTHLPTEERNGGIRLVFIVSFRSKRWFCVHRFVSRAAQRRSAR